MPRLLPKEADNNPIPAQRLRGLYFGERVSIKKSLEAGAGFHRRGNGAVIEEFQRAAHGHAVRQARDVQIHALHMVHQIMRSRLAVHGSGEGEDYFAYPAFAQAGHKLVYRQLGGPHAIEGG